MLSPGLDALRRLREQQVQRPESEKTITEAQRILALPTWDPSKFTVALTDTYKLPGGTMTLKPVQSLSLYWARQIGGLLAPLAVGAGKTLLTLLLPIAMGARRPVLFIPPSMQIPIRREIEKLSKHWRLPLTKTATSEPLMIVPYSQLSVASSTSLLEQLRPDLIIADECQNLRFSSASRVKRVNRWMDAYPETRFVALSGTLTSKELRDYAHLAAWALRQQSPLPLHADELIAWGNCIDSDGTARPQDWSSFEQFHPTLDQDADQELLVLQEEFRQQSELAREAAAAGKSFEVPRTPTYLSAKRKVARRAFLSRFHITPGVVATTESSVACSLYLRERKIDVPTEVFAAINDLHTTWCRPDGEELVTGLDKWRCAMQLAQGFFYRWVWPNGIPDQEWLSARAAWHRTVRQTLQLNLAGLDSPLLVTRAVMDSRLDQFVEMSPMVPARALISTWNTWDSVRHRPKPPVDTVWLSDFLLRDVVQWHLEHPKGIIWYDDRAVERALRVLAPAIPTLEVYGAGEDPPEDGRGMACSINAHGTGRNLQANSEALIVSFPGSGKTNEQLLGRLHRQGQEADEVLFDYYAPTTDAREAIRKATRDATYIQETQGSPQKLLYAAWI